MGAVAESLETLTASRPRAPRSQPQLSELLEIATGTTSRTVFRADAFDWIQRAVGFDAIFLGDPLISGPRGPTIMGFDSKFVARFEAGTERYRSTLGALLATSAEQRGPILDTDVFPPSQRQRLPYYDEIINQIVPHKHSEVILCALMMGDRLVGQLQFSRTSRDDPYSAAHHALIRDAMRVLALGESSHARLGDANTSTAPDLEEDTHWRSGWASF